MKQHIASTVNDNIQHRMRIYIQPDVVQCLPSFRLAAALALPAHPPPTDNAQQGGGLYTYIPNQTYGSVKFRLLFLSASNKVRGARRRYGRLKH